MVECPSIVTETRPAESTAYRRDAAGTIKRLVLPSISDVLYIVFLFLLFMFGSSWSTLLGDGDTGWHIRTGEYILRTHTVPVRDLFSSTAPGTTWYAWEWLADVLFAALHNMAGLKGVVLFSGSLICLTLVILFRHMIWRGTSLHIALILSVLAANALRFHYLARPHIFTTLFFVVALWMLDRDWSRPSGAIWLLIPITILWTNLHGGFLVLLIALGFFAVSALVRREQVLFRRYAALSAICGAATLINPYGWELHRHIWEYLRSDWLVRYIDEYRSPFARLETDLRFEILLFLGLACTWELFRRRRYHEALLILFWAHCALMSVRHVTMYVVAASLPIGEQLSRVWNAWTKDAGRRSVRHALQTVVEDMGPAATRTSIWVPALLILLAWGNCGVKWPVDFPSKFPTELIARNAGLLNGSGHEDARILNPDAWGGYLDYKFYPNRHAFIDGRSDYFGPVILSEYRSIRSADEKWPELDERYRWQFALIPADWPLAAALKQSPEWVLRDQDQIALLFERRVRPKPR